MSDDEYAELGRPLYEKSWKHKENHNEIIIEDTTEMLTPTAQTKIPDLLNGRYRVLEREHFEPEPRLQDEFRELDEALEYVEENYSINP